MNIKERNKLENKIEHLRNLMNSAGRLKGLNHTKTLKYSQELDNYLNKYHQVNKIE